MHLIEIKEDARSHWGTRKHRFASPPPRERLQEKIICYLRKVKRFFNAIALKDDPYAGLLLAISLTVLMYKALPSFAFTGYPLKDFVWNWSLFLFCGVLLFGEILHLAYSAISALTQTHIPNKCLRFIVEELTYILFTPFGFVLIAWICWFGNPSVCLFGVSFACHSHHVRSSVHASFLDMSHLSRGVQFPKVGNCATDKTIHSPIFFASIQLAFFIFFCMSF